LNEPPAVGRARNRVHTSDIGPGYYLLSAHRPHPRKQLSGACADRLRPPAKSDRWSGGLCGAMLSDKRELVGDEIDRRAHQTCARLRLLSACRPRSFGDGWCFQNGMRRRCFFRPVRRRSDWCSPRHNMVRNRKSWGQTRRGPGLVTACQLRVQYLKDPPLSKEKW